MGLKNIATLTRKLLLAVGENPGRNGLLETPTRVENFYSETLAGYKEDVKAIFKTFDFTGSENLITVTEIPFYSLCEHHIVPFFGRIDIGYVPNKKILGLSKFVRLVNIYAKRLQVQENLTSQVATAVMKYLKPKGVIVLSRAEHLCMSMRGVKTPGSITKVVVKEGVFKKDRKLVNDFYNLTQHYETK